MTCLCARARFSVAVPSTSGTAKNLPQVDNRSERWLLAELTNSTHHSASGIHSGSIPLAASTLRQNFKTEPCPHSPLLHTHMQMQACSRQGSSQRAVLKWVAVRCCVMYQSRRMTVWRGFCAFRLSVVVLSAEYFDVFCVF